MIRATVAAAALSLTLPAAAQDGPPAAATAANETAAIDQAMARAQLLYWYDQAAWHGTDDMLAKARDLSDRIGGWIVDGSADAPTLIFYSRDARPVPLYLARLANNRVVEGRRLSEGESGLLTPARQRLIAAQAAARAAVPAAQLARCADKPFNTVVLPPETPDGPIAVYFLTPQASNDAIPLGGHYRFEVDAAGKVGPVRRFTNSCIATPMKDAKGKPVALTVSHLLDPIPTEIHGFSAMAARMPLIVITRDKRLWIVTPTPRGPRVRAASR